MSTTMDQIHHIRDMYYQQDKNISQIASETGLNRKTVSKYVDMEDFNTHHPHRHPRKSMNPSSTHSSHLLKNGLNLTNSHRESNATPQKEYIEDYGMKPKASTVAIVSLHYTSQKKKRNSV